MPKRRWVLEELSYDSAPAAARPIDAQGASPLSSASSCAADGETVGSASAAAETKARDQKSAAQESTAVSAASPHVSASREADCDCSFQSASSAPVSAPRAPRHVITVEQLVQVHEANGRKVRERHFTRDCLSGHAELYEEPFTGGFGRSSAVRIILMRYRDGRAVSVVRGAKASGLTVQECSESLAARCRRIVHAGE
jgi:hypothetical protein